MGGYIVVPGTGERIYDGTIVVLQRVPDLKWVVHYGFYIYEGEKRDGWYLVSIPAQVVNPLMASDLVGIRIVSYGPTPVPPFPPFPPGPVPGGDFTEEDRKFLNESMITVNTIEDRDAIMGGPLVNGKVCRVNDYEGHVEYFQWNALELRWELLDFGPRVALIDQIQTEFVTEEEITQNYLTKDDIQSTYITQESVAETYISKEDVAETYASKDEVAETYASKEDVASTYASKEEVSTTYASKEEVAETYASKEEVAETYPTREEIADTYATSETVTEVADDLEELSTTVTEKLEEIEEQLDWLTLGG